MSAPQGPGGPGASASQTGLRARRHRLPAVSVREGHARGSLCCARRYIRAGHTGPGTRQAARAGVVPEGLAVISVSAPHSSKPAGLRGPRICTPPGPRRVIGAPGDAARGVCGERGGSQARHLLRVTDLRRGRAGAASLYPGWRGRETAGAGQPCGFAGRPPCLWASRGAAFRTRSSPRSEGRHLLGSLLCQQPSHTSGSQGGRGKGSGFPWMIP